jgi:hypothetical protein
VTRVGGDRGLGLEVLAGYDRLGFDGQDVALQLVHELGTDVLAQIDRVGVVRVRDGIEERLNHTEAALLERLDVLYDCAIVGGVCLAHFNAQLFCFFDDRC